MFEINEDLVYLIEAMKVEGYWNLKNNNATITNKNLSFITHIENILKNNNIYYYKNLRIKVRIPPNFTANDIEVFDGHKSKKFCIETSGFNDLIKNIVFDSAFKSEWFTIKIKEAKFSLNVIQKTQMIETKCDIPSFCYCSLRFYKREFLKFLDAVSNKSKKNLGVTTFLNNANPSITISAFGALVDSEGTIDYSKNRRIHIRMKSKNYLEAWKEILSRYNIHSFTFKVNGLYGLTVCGWENLKKLSDYGFKLFHSEKLKKFKILMKSFTRHYWSLNTAKTICFNKLKELRRAVTARELSKLINKHTYTVHHYLRALEKENKVTIDKSTLPYRYFLVV